jgi:small GTP-binding protein
MILHQAKVCLLGNFAVGKTSLVRRFVEDRFDDRYLSTIGVKISRKILDRSWGRLKLLIWDLAGEEKFVQYFSSYLEGAAGGLIVCDLTRKETLDSLSYFAEQLQAVASTPDMVFVGNKLDLAGQQELHSKNLEDMSRKLGGPYLLTSAKTGENTETAFQLLAELIEKRHGWDVD